MILKTKNYLTLCELKKKNYREEEWSLEIVQSLHLSKNK